MKGGKFASLQSWSSCHYHQNSKMGLELDSVLDHRDCP
jgi:hypothetical protein